jgi:hypothetical protein
MFAALWMALIITPRQFVTFYPLLAIFAGLQCQGWPAWRLVLIAALAIWMSGAVHLSYSQTNAPPWAIWIALAALLALRLVNSRRQCPERS